MKIKVLYAVTGILWPLGIGLAWRDHWELGMILTLIGVVSSAIGLFIQISKGAEEFKKEPGI